MTKEEFNSWLQGLSEADKQKATGFFLSDSTWTGQETDPRSLQRGLQRVSGPGGEVAA